VEEVESGQGILEEAVLEEVIGTYIGSCVGVIDIGLVV
jgi:hypothetical protein